MKVEKDVATPAPSISKKPIGLLRTTLREMTVGESVEQEFESKQEARRWGAKWKAAAQAERKEGTPCAITSRSEETNGVVTVRVWRITPKK